MANHKLAKTIQDIGFYEFRRQLTYQMRLLGFLLEFLLGLDIARNILVAFVREIGQCSKSQSH